MSRAELILACTIAAACSRPDDPAVSDASSSASGVQPLECASAWDCDVDYCAAEPEVCGPLGNLVEPNCLRPVCIDDDDCPSGYVCFHDGFNLTPDGPTLSCDRDFPPGVPPPPDENSCYCTADIRPCAGLCVLAEDAAAATSGADCDSPDTGR